MSTDMRKTADDLATFFSTVCKGGNYGICGSKSPEPLRKQILAWRAYPGRTHFADQDARLLNNGCIAEVNEQDAAISAGLLEAVGDERNISIPIVQETDENGEAEVFSIPLTEGDVQEVFAVMQMTVDEAAKAIEKIENENILIVLHGADSRQGVKKAAKKQAEKITETEAEEQQEG